MKNLKIIVILCLVLIVSYFLFMVGGGKDAIAPVVDESLLGDYSDDRSFASWFVGDRDYKTFGILNFQYVGSGALDSDNGETSIIFGDYINGTLTLSFMGKEKDSFVFDQGAPYMDSPIIVYSFEVDGVQKVYRGSGTGVMSLILERWDEEFVEGVFEGVLTNEEDVTLEDQLVISDGIFKIDLKKYPLKEI